MEPFEKVTRPSSSVDIVVLSLPTSIPLNKFEVISLYIKLWLEVPTGLWERWESYSFGYSLDIQICVAT